VANRILITGGNGYVGRYLTRLLCQDAMVYVADSLRCGGWRFDAAECRRLRLVRLDLRDAEQVRALMRRVEPEIVVHLAALHYIPECEGDPSLAVATNVLGTVNLLAHCKPHSRFVFASSGAVYKPDDQPHREAEAALAPNDVYGRTKLHAEEFVSDFATRLDLQAVIVRLFNVVGPGETNPHLLPELVAQLKAGCHIVRLGNMTPKRDYIHVVDAAKGFAAVAVGNGVDYGQTMIVNVGTSQVCSVAQIVEKIRAVSGIDFEIHQDDSRLRKFDRPFLAADIHRMSQYFGWRPERSIDDAIRDLWSNPDLAAV